ncbi:MAG: chemotaxis protein CheW [Rhodospirillales bacterium]|nr:chemotaxis protein CheW [Rhodospirillales bacterium]
MSARNDARLLSVTLAGQEFGIPVMQVRDVLGPQRTTVVPLAPRGIAGLLNLRGRIVTVIDMRALLGLPPSDGEARPMQVVVEHGEDSFSLRVDSVGDVLELPDESFERTLSTLDPAWRDVAAGIYRLPGRLLVSLDLSRLLDFKHRAAA